MSNVTTFTAMEETITTKKGTLLKHQDFYDLRKQIESLDSPSFDPAVLSKGLEIAAFYVENGYTKFLDFSHQMLKDVGNCIRPFLKAVYSGVRYCPGLESFSGDMSSTDFVDRIDLDTIKQDNMFYGKSWKMAFGAWHATEFIEKGFYSIGDYAALMIKDFGDAIRPVVVNCYEQAREWFDYNKRQDILDKMDPAEVTKKFDAARFDK